MSILERPRRGVCLLGRLECKSKKDTAGDYSCQSAYIDVKPQRGIAGHQTCIVECLTQAADDTCILIYRGRHWSVLKGQGQDVSLASIPTHTHTRKCMRAYAYIHSHTHSHTHTRAHTQVGGAEPSPDHNLYAWSEDTVGGEKYTLRVKSLATGTEVMDAIPETSGDVEWANDNATLFYVVKDQLDR
eukprot:1158474-Pelagomonas_calceolata.AAC.3